MQNLEQSIDVQVPVDVAYDQWTQFQTFPHFMQGIERVEQRDDRHLHWTANIGGKHEEWDAEITEQIPGKRVAWRSTSGAHNAGVVTFHRLDDGACRVMLQLEFEPETVTEKIGGALGVVDWRVAGDLAGFKDFVEKRRKPTGASNDRILAPHERGAPANGTV